MVTMGSESVMFVKGANLSQYVQQTVVFAGKVISTQGDILTLQTGDDVSVQLQKNPATSVSSSFILVKGVVIPNSPVREVQIYSLGESFGNGIPIQLWRARSIVFG
mmetsp:Transcript_15328/g.62549  ORF Transcript_15328/g.62549 Transcript_15328/m.62549 type:complete len:106 (-) Transcript_15328:2125-2442(-)